MRRALLPMKEVRLPSLVLGGDDAEQVSNNDERLQQALAQGDADGVEKIAHSLKGELGYLAIPEVAQKARELEQMGRKSDLQNAATLLTTLNNELSAVLASMRSVKEQDNDKTAGAASGAGSLMRT